MAKSPLAALLVVCLLLSAPLYAHRLKVFATAEGARIDGEAYFVGGGVAAGAVISVLDAKDRELARLTPDATGSFSYTATQRMDHKLVADTMDGHRASWTVRADELPLTLPLPPDAKAATAVESASSGEPQTSPSPSMPTDRELDFLVERAVARQVRPLREQLTAYGDQVRLHDILGGFGYIAGIAGLGLWWRSRRQKG
jgi:nickel transport protein